MAQDVYDLITEEISVLKQSYEAKVSDGKLSLSEAFQLGRQAVNDVVGIVEKSGGSAAEKKDSAVKGVMRLVDEVVLPAALKTRGVLVRRAVTAAVDSILPEIVSHAVDLAVANYNDAGIFVKPQATT